MRILMRAIAYSARASDWMASCMPSCIGSRILVLLCICLYVFLVKKFQLLQYCNLGFRGMDVARATGCVFH